MKFPQQDRKIKTSCKNCAFATFEGLTQNGCSFDRITKFDKDAIEAYDNEKEFYVINRLCNYYRDKAWGYSENDASIVEKESSVSMDILFDCTSIKEEKCANIIDSINSLEYYDEKINFILLQTKINDSYDKINQEILDIYPKINKKITVSVCENIPYFIHNLLLKTKNFYHIFVDANTKLDIQLVNKVEDYVNSDLKKFLVAQHKDIKIIRNLCYKYLNHMFYNPNYFENIESIISHCKDTEAYIEL
jgi:hypothetical protein